MILATREYFARTLFREAPVRGCEVCEVEKAEEITQVLFSFRMKQRADVSDVKLMDDIRIEF